MRLGTVALGAATAAGLSAGPADAANGDPVLVGGNYTSTGITTITLVAAGDEMAAIHGAAADPMSNNAGVAGESNSTQGAGVVGIANALTGLSYGVVGTTASSGGAGVAGYSSDNDGATAGVMGHAESPAGVGVRGSNLRGGAGVLGEIPSNSDSNGIAVYGFNSSSYAGPSPGAGGFGVYGLSAKGHGLVGATAASGAAALVGATNGVAGAYAATFYGPVVVSGSFTVTGAKSAAVPHPDGSHKRVYCVESPESWFEDFGHGQLECGQASITFDPNFATLVDPADYHLRSQGGARRVDGAKLSSV